jgi:hypothetical protein
VDAQLNALILRMLSPRPEERGAAGELAEAMKRGVAHAGPSADVLLFEWETQPPSEWTEEEQAEAEQCGHRPRRRDRQRARRAEQSDAVARAEVEGQEAAVLPARQMKPRRWLPWLAAVVALGLWPEETGSMGSGQHPTVAYRASEAERDAVSLGDTALSSSAASAKAPTRGVTTQKSPKQPLPGQLKPDASGRCDKGQIALNGGCWVKADVELNNCPGSGFVYQGGCYVPIFAPVREPTAVPQEREP